LFTNLKISNIKVSSSSLNTSNLFIIASIARFDQTLFYACRKLFHFRFSVPVGTFNLFKCDTNSSDALEHSLQISLNRLCCTTSSSLLRTKFKLFPTLSCNLLIICLRRTGTVSALAFSLRMRSVDLYRSLLLETISQEKSTNWMTDAAIDKAESGSTGISEFETIRES
jgi:hypothetical protein